MQSYELKYISLVSSSLRNFKDKGNHCWNFSCPYCGDSEKDKRKARGYFINYKDTLFYKCHNCQVSCRFSSFLKQQFPAYYQQYIFEKLKDNVEETIFKVTPIASSNNTLQTRKINLPSLSELPKDHPAIEYYDSRKLPEHTKKYLYYTDDFRKFALDTFQNEKYSNLKDNDARIVLPCFSRAGFLKSTQGRAIDKNDKQRYVSARYENTQPPFIFGLDRVDFTKTVYVVEGAFDSLLIPNAIAVNTSSLSSIIYNLFLGIDEQHLMKNCVMVHDNQPRNKEIIHEYEKSIKKGFAVVLFPQTLKEKDLNEIHLTGTNVYDIIKQNTFSGIELEIMFSSYRKC